MATIKRIINKIEDLSQLPQTKARIKKIAQLKKISNKRILQ